MKFNILAKQNCAVAIEIDIIKKIWDAVPRFVYCIRALVCERGVNKGIEKASHGFFSPKREKIQFFFLHFSFGKKKTHQILFAGSVKLRKF